MLPLEVYTELHELAAHSPGHTIVEIGTAHGAGAIALCLGALSANKTPEIYTVDRFEGRYSSRSAFGSVLDNLEIVRGNFKSAGVDPYVKIFAGSSSDFAEQQCPDEIDILVLDADGRIDRDLINFADKLADDAAIVVDDYDNRVILATRTDGATYVALKQVITKLLIDRYAAEGLIDVINIRNSTVFCRKRAGSIWDKQKMASAALECYRELLCADIDRNTVFSWLREKVKARIPSCLMRRLRHYRWGMRQLRLRRHDARLTAAMPEDRPA
jgi:predicted O-methyltransferase YrrM